MKAWESDAVRRCWPGAVIWQIFLEKVKMLGEGTKRVLFHAARRLTMAQIFRDVTNHDHLATRPQFSVVSDLLI